MTTMISPRKMSRETMRVAGAAVVVVATGAVAEMVVAMVLPFEGDILSHVGRRWEKKVSVVTN
jgi:hypothetical protein